MCLRMYKREMFGEEDKSKAVRKGRGRGKRERKGAGGKEKQDKVHFSSLLP